MRGKLLIYQSMFELSNKNVCFFLHGVFGLTVGVKAMMKSQLRLFRCLNWVLPGCLPVEVFQACTSGRRPQARPRTRGIRYPI